jgi:hypothetical protein
MIEARIMKNLRCLGASRSHLADNMVRQEKVSSLISVWAAIAKAQGCFLTTSSVTYCDLETGRRLKFLTNNFALPPLAIAEIYKKRWGFSDMIPKRRSSNLPTN